MSDFIFETTPRIICQAGGAARLGELSKDLGARHMFVVTDQGLVKAGLLAPVVAAMEAAGVKATLFSDVLADPPEDSVLAAVAAAKAAGIDGVIGFGGGSSLDTAKLVALLAGMAQDLPAIYGIGLAKGPRRPLAPARKSRPSPSSPRPAMKRRV